MLWDQLACPGASFCVGSSAARVMRLRRQVHHDRCDVFLPVSKSDGSCSSLQLRRSIECSDHVPRLPGSLAHKNGHPCGHVGEARLFVSPSPFEVPPMLGNTRFVRGAIPGWMKKESRPGEADDVWVDLSADVAQSIRSVGHNSRAHAVKDKILHRDNVDKRVQNLLPGTTVRGQGDGTLLRRACTNTREGLEATNKNSDWSKCGFRDCTANPRRDSPNIPSAFASATNGSLRCSSHTSRWVFVLPKISSLRTGS